MIKTTLELDTKLHKTIKTKCCLLISLSHKLNSLFFSQFHPSFLSLTPLVVARKAGVDHRAEVARKAGVVRRAEVVRM